MGSYGNSVNMRTWILLALLFCAMAMAQNSESDGGSNVGTEFDPPIATGENGVGGMESNESGQSGESEESNESDESDESDESTGSIQPNQKTKEIDIENISMLTLYKHQNLIAKTIL